MNAQILELTSADHPGLAPYFRLTEAQLRAESCGLFIAESPKVIHAALDCGYTPVSLLCERRHLDGDAAPLLPRLGGCPVYTGSRELLASITGYTLTRGVLCAMRRRPLPSPAEVCRGARLVVVLDGIVDTTNIGSVFRSAVALGVDGILLTNTSCDPLNRRAVRVSMGTVFRIPWTRTAFTPDTLRELGAYTAAMALCDASVPLGSFAPPPGLLALYMGNEGDGLAPEVIAACDATVRIPMAYGVDSLNVGAAAAVAIWHIKNQQNDHTD